MTTDPIRILIKARGSAHIPVNPREDFWERVNTGSTPTENIASLETKLYRKFGNSLHRKLVQHLAEPLRAFDHEIFEPGSRWFWEFRNFNKLSNDREQNEHWARTQYAETFYRLCEKRLQVLLESPSLRSASERLTLAAGIVFLPRIAGYSSLTLDLWVGSFNHLVSVFENDFESFRVFLEVFVPRAFADVFSEAAADELDFSVNIPTSFKRAFLTAAIEAPSTEIASPSPQTSKGSHGSARERAEWLWRLANGSLLIPVLLALFVFYYGMKILTDMRDTQFKAVEPVLMHQLKLLEEDRRRLSQDVPRSTDPSLTHAQE